eukprot:gnl/Spiro4/3856_TR1902_c0_g1_i1.p1 gnl/Spiro4/3856_TR1902_c0_g1~~gnl/Spiro4/3856_TR1902_c0_g1_i1.p1  ORF type:complete len:356 (+),score=80.33 gnl/Spiro4/3856_TR1902_c0_g1_i1:45-1070(+)
MDRQQVAQAVTALSHHTELSRENPLAEESTSISLMFSLRKIPQRRNTKPIRIPLVHTLYPEGTEICLISKDPQKTFRELIESKKVTAVTKVISVSKLRTNHKSYEQKRLLCAAYKLFLADDRVLPLLPALLGKTFFAKKKQPLAVNLTAPDLNREINRAVSGTQLFLGGASPCCNVKVGNTGMLPEMVVDNILEAAKHVVAHVPKQWKSIQAIHLKTPTSVSLPLYNSLSEEAVAHVSAAHSLNPSPAVKQSSLTPTSASNKNKKRARPNSATTQKSSAVPAKTPAAAVSAPRAGAKRPPPSTTPTQKQSPPKKLKATPQATTTTTTTTTASPKKRRNTSR